MTSLIPPVTALQKWFQPLGEAIGLRSLHLHVHEIAIAALFYHLIFTSFAPAISRWLVPRHYRQFDTGTTLKWNLQCVSMVQSILISALAFWVMANDKQRQRMTPEERVWGYSGPAGTVQAFATGYFLWDLLVTLQNLEHLGLPVLIHASSCSAVYLLGFRPVFNYYSCVFVLYELSTPFLNIHLFLDQLGKAGSTMQVVNGLMLMVVFFSARLVWGFYSSFQWYMDMWTASQRTWNGITEVVPPWLIATFMTSNLALNSLNVFWFGKMVEAIGNRAQGSRAKAD